MNTVHLLSSSVRETNTQYHLRKLMGNTTNVQTLGAPSNQVAIGELCQNGGFAFVPYYNVLGKSVADTMRTIAENYQILRLHSITRMRIEYVLAMRKGVQIGDISDVYSHPQALLQTIGERMRIIPNAQEQTANSTAAGLEIVLDPLNVNKSIAAITTPFQIHTHELGQLTTIDTFGPPDNHTYFALLGLKDATIEIPHLTSSPNHSVMSDEAIKFGVLTIPNHPGSLCDALGNISARGIDIMSIMSFLQSNDTVIFTIAYQWESSHIIGTQEANHKKPTISEIQSHDNQNFSARIHIPNNIRGSLYNTLRLLKETINLQEIASIGTGMDTVDFEIKFSLIAKTSDDIESKLNQLLLASSVEPSQIICPTREEIRKILHNLH